MLGTFLLTVVFDLTVALQVGLILACLLLVRSMSTLIQVVETARMSEPARFTRYGALFLALLSSWTRF